MRYEWAIEKRDVGKIEKLNKLTNIETFFDDVRNLMRYPMSDHNLHRWECLSDMRYEELETGMEKYTAFVGWNEEMKSCYEIMTRPRTV